MTSTPGPGRESDGPDALRKAGLRRALVGTVALLGLSSALWWVEGEEKPVERSTADLSAPDSVNRAEGPAAAPAMPPTPVPPAESPSNAPVQAGAAPDALPPVGALTAPDAPPSAAGSVTTGSLVSADSPTVAASAAPVPSAVLPQGDAPRPEAAAGPASAADCPAPSAEASPAEPPRPALASLAAPGPGYLIQLGVFLDPGNADSMRRELERKGYPAHLQARVVLGPYRDRAAALAAQEKIRRERKLDGMILGPRK